MCICMCVRVYIGPSPSDVGSVIGRLVVVVMCCVYAYVYVCTLPRT